MATSYLLPPEPAVRPDLLAAVAGDFARLARTGLPRPLEPYLAERYRIDVRSSYAGLPVRNPWGKASGQLSMTLAQVEEDVAAGLGFVVLKTVIAEDPAGDRSMAAWAIPESRMKLEPITGRSGETGWTVTWRGRGWWQSFDAYLDLVRRATDLGRQAGVLIVPSCKYHLPAPGETAWRTAEYEHTTRRLGQASSLDPLPLEKDFSPTLAGSVHSRQQEQIVQWLDNVPRLIRKGGGGRRILLGLKLFNAVFDDEFQLAMLGRIHAGGADRPDFVVYANRLIDPDRGLAYGGPDLGDRNLRVLDRFLAALRGGSIPGPPLEISATGNIHSGRMALEYALRGCTSFQVHTLFQLPASAYTLRVGSKTDKALHQLYFHPRDGFIVWLHHLAQRYGLEDRDRVIHFARLRRCVGM